MPKPDHNFRTDPNRAVYVFGEFKDELIAKLLPQIEVFRATNNDPISVFINSPGGSVRCLDLLSGALRAQNPDGQHCRIITCSNGDAASAAATMLALGDYAISHAHSLIHFHGMRLTDPEITVTMEDASQLATYLDRRNREIAAKLADFMLPRLIHRYFRLKGDFQKIRDHSQNQNLADMACFAEAIKKRVSNSCVKVIEKSIRRLARIQSLSQVFNKPIVGRTKDPLKQDVAVFNQVIQHEIRENKGKKWRLDENGVSHVVSDYFLLRDYYFGEHKEAVDPVVEIFGIEFLQDTEFKEYEKLIKSSPEEAKKLLFKKSKTILEPFWYFTVCIARHLQQGENRLSATDAYWIGAVDEVLGTDCFGLRSAIELEPDNGQPQQA